MRFIRDESDAALKVRAALIRKALKDRKKKPERTAQDDLLHRWASTPHRVNADALAAVEFAESLDGERKSCYTVKHDDTDRHSELRGLPTALEPSRRADVSGQPERRADLYAVRGGPNEVSHQPRKVPLWRKATRWLRAR